jgi:hypothetical protein
VQHGCDRNGKSNLRHVEIARSAGFIVHGTLYEAAPRYVSGETVAASATSVDSAEPITHAHREALHNASRSQLPGCGRQVADGDCHRAHAFRIPRPGCI